MKLQNQRIVLGLVITITMLATIGTNQLVNAELPSAELALDVQMASMNAASLMNQITDIVTECSYNIYDAAYIQQCLNFTLDLNVNMESVINKYPAINNP